MRVLAAADKFKGTFSAEQICAALARGARSVGHEAVDMPVADGGEGTAEALVHVRGGEWVEVPTEDALGRPVEARYALIDEGATAVVEVAAASGLWRLDPDELRALDASTRGTGTLIADAVGRGAETVIVAAGGSATTDGGMGIVEVVEGLDRRPRIVVVSDVQIPIERAARMFAPQKGASEHEVELLVERLDRIAERAPRDPRGVPMSGCAGGVGGGLHGYLGAELVAGAPFVLDQIGFDRALGDADLTLTGEGSIDAQTLEGKAVSGIATRAAAAGVPCVAVVGRNQLSASDRSRIVLADVVEASTIEEIEAAGADACRRIPATLE